MATAAVASPRTAMAAAAGANSQGVADAKAVAEAEQEAAQAAERRFAQHSEEWMQLLRSALPEALEQAAAARAALAAEAAEAAAAADAEAQKQRKRAEARAAAASKRPTTPTLSEPSAKPRQRCSGGGVQDSGPAAAADAGASDAAGGAKAEGDAPGLASSVSFLLTGFDKLFTEQGQKDPATARAPMRYKVKVPDKYPGVQFRRTKNLQDRYPKYAMNGAVVKGLLEDDGEWLKLGETIFLPMHVGGNKILEAEGSSEPKRSFWFACGQGALAEDEEVLNNLEDPPH